MAECQGTMQKSGGRKKGRTCLSKCHVLMIADINECIQEPCGNQDQARCSNSNGSYICFCDIIGYGWNGTACEGTAQSMLRQTHIIISTLVCRC